jgi:DNA-directed RNA polymerase subunit RPC12/RpoP
MKDTFVTIATFQYSSEAHITRGKLESEGVKVFMADDITIDTDPLMSNAIGGVKLKVSSKQEEKAREVLNSISKYSLDNEGKAIVCKNCGSEKVDYFSTVKDKKSFFWFLLGFLYTALPFYTKYKYRCENCKSEFEK